MKRCGCNNYLFLILGCVAMIACGCDRDKTFTVKTEIVRVDSPDQIILIDDSLVKPVIYTNVSDLDKLPFHKAKPAFISAVLPAILVARHDIETTRQKITRLKAKKEWSTTDSLFYQQNKNKYYAKSLDDLIVRIGTLPNSIVIAQAAVETGWGASRFFLEGNNLFGIWSTSENESRMAAGKTRQNKTIWLRSYDDISQSVRSYFEMLGNTRAYENLRQARAHSSDPFVLLPHLKHYSEQKNAYVAKLKKIIEQNDLTQYDHYMIDPQYLVEED
jgi:Bax protein